MGRKITAALLCNRSASGRFFRALVVELRE
jgi:hypothetical protein